MRYNVLPMAFFYTMLGITPLYAAEYINNHVVDAEIVGQGRARMMFWDVYDAKLYAPNGVYDDNKPLALELSYLQELKGEKIADHAAEEMRRFGYNDETRLSSWHKQMNSFFPDVTEGSVVTGVYTGNGTTVFYKDGNKIGRIEDPAFGKEFFRIWLDARTSMPALRQSLLNLENHMKGHNHETPSQHPAAGGNHVD